MTQTILFLHGGGRGAYEADAKLVAFLRDALGSDYDVHYPQMPNADSPKYAAWRDRIQSELGSLQGDVMLVGHSLGGSVLLKFLSEEKVDKSIAGLFLLAPPYWGTPDWEVDEYTLAADFAARLPDMPRIVLYHSRDDKVVPFAHQALYAQQLLHATVRPFDDRGHQFQDDLSAVVADIQRAMQSHSPLNLSFPSERELVLTRTFNAPRARLFAAMTQPEHVRQWYGRRSDEMIVCEIDLRVGGHWRFAVRAEDGNEYAFSGEYREITPPERVVFTEEFETMPGTGYVVTSTFTEEAGKTTLHSHILYQSQAHRDGHLGSGMEAGASETYDRLAEYLTAMERAQ